MRAKLAKILLAAAISSLLTMRPLVAQIIELPAELTFLPTAVIVDQGVKDECWTNADDVEAAVTLPLRQSGMQFTERRQLGDLALMISTLGGRADSGLCFGLLTIELVQMDSQDFPDGTWIYARRITMYRTSAVSPDELDSQFVDFAESTGRKLANMILQARQPAIED